MELRTIEVISQILVEVLLQVNSNFFSHIIIDLRFWSGLHIWRSFFTMLLLNKIEHRAFHFSQTLHHEPHIGISWWELDSETAQFSIVHAEARIFVLLHHKGIVP